MLKRQLVLVAIDHATNVERTMDAALSTAKARGADVDVIQVVPHRAVPVDDRYSIDGRSSFTTIAASPLERDSHRCRDRRTMMVCVFDA